MTEALPSFAVKARQWIRHKAWVTLVHTYVLCGAVAGVVAGLLQTARSVKFDKASLISLWKGSGAERPSVKTLGRVDSHRIRISEDSGDRGSFDEIPALKDSISESGTVEEKKRKLRLPSFNKQTFRAMTSCLIPSALSPDQQPPSAFKQDQDAHGRPSSGGVK